MVQELLTSSLCAVSRLTEVEVTSALERRCREGSFGNAERNRALSALRLDLRRLVIAEVTARVSASAAALLARHPLRAGDAIQLACALELHDKLRYPLTLVAFDRRLSEAATHMGLATQPHLSRQ